MLAEYGFDDDQVEQVSGKEVEDGEVLEREVEEITIRIDKDRAKAEAYSRDRAYRIAALLHRIGNGTNPSVIARLLRMDAKDVVDGMQYGHRIGLLYTVYRTQREPIVWLA